MRAVDFTSDNEWVELPLFSIQSLKIMKYIIVVFLLIVGMSLRSGGQSPAVTGALQQSKLSMKMEKGRLTGPAFEWIKERAQNSDFILFGETHRVAEIPEIVGATYRQLYDQGFHYLALEMGPFVAAELSSAEKLGKRRSIKRQIVRHPSSIAFAYDQEVSMLKEVGEIFDGKGQVFWGLDNAFGGWHLLKRLKELTRGDQESQQLVREILKKATRSKDGHEYLAEASHLEDFKRLRKQLNPAEGSETDQIIDALEVSNRIFYNYRLAYSIKKDRMTAYANRKEREELMKQQFIDQYHQTKALGVDRPKVIFKFGGAHIEPGIAPNLVTTLGTFVNEFAIAEGTEATHIAILCFNEKNCNQLNNPAMAPLAQLVKEDIALFDFTELKDKARKGELDGLNKELQSYILRYDALIMVHESQKAGIAIIAQAKIRSILLSNWPFIVLGLLVIGGAWWLIKRRKNV